MPAEGPTPDLGAQPPSSNVPSAIKDRKDYSQERKNVCTSQQRDGGVLRKKEGEKERGRIPGEMRERLAKVSILQQARGGKGLLCVC